MTVSELDAFARKSLAGYKIPRRMIVVDAVQRAPNGKPDYRWPGPFPRPPSGPPRARMGKPPAKDRKSTRLNSSPSCASRIPFSAFKQKLTSYKKIHITHL